ncbi:S8 family serine peptidase [Shewanella salipaludis]|uniref:S8 family serine peptidase n=1 Tax=Shewanella salipaludis TaxID=2723052 RepID=A0A972JJG7_9GAMM|nr:S8 family serine peptidase [Shewanella salipaludis]NMH64029.1 S8 family serine peptidase [Shewanella salipaludis]
MSSRLKQANINARPATDYVLTRHLMPGQILKLETDSDGLADTLAKLNRLDGVRFAEPDVSYYPDELPTDPDFGELWGLHNTGQNGGTPDADLDAPEAWQISRGARSIAVAVIDTGVDYTHPDLAANMWTNPNEIPGDGMDNDNNGYIDDIHGINAVTNSGDPMDDHSHGTHVAGTIGASANNGIGVVGVNQQASIIGCKFLRASGGGSVSDAIKCLDYLIGLKQAGTNVRVTNNSWGGGSYSPVLELAIERARDADILFVTSAGNAGDNTDHTPHYPSSYQVENVISVAATTRYDSLAGFSNYGKNSVHLGAPGQGIYSTIPNARYGSKSGTSMASPHVAGAAALLLAANPELDNNQVVEILLSSGDPIDALADTTLSGRRLNLANALAEAALPGFVLEGDTAPVSIEAGESSQFHFTLAAFNGWQGEVGLRVEGELGAALSHPRVGAGDSFVVTVTSTQDTPAGQYTLTLSAADGVRVKTRTLTVEVIYGDLVTEPFENPQSMAIPDNDANGVVSEIRVATELVPVSATVSVDISHTWRGDLRVSLISPSGGEQVLHDRAGGNADNLKQSWQLDKLSPLQGPWQLKVQDLSGYDQGTLNGWKLAITGRKEQNQGQDPEAGFDFSYDGLQISCRDLSQDPDGDIVEWYWQFGDGQSSTLANPQHKYAEAGEYPVSLTVTDSRGGSDTQTRMIRVGDFRLSLVELVPHPDGSSSVVLGWQGGEAGFVTVYRDGNAIGSYFNFGTHTDRLHLLNTVHSYRVCDSHDCSNELRVEP